MKIVCDACQAKYSISDDKVQGKVFKIRCKKCSNIIVVRGGANAAEPAPAPAAEKDTRVYDYGYEGGAPAGDESVWHVVINQDQVGPMTAAEVQQRFAAGEIDAETYAWREGFTDWLPLSQVDAFASFAQGGGESAAAAAGGGAAGADPASLFGTTGIGDDAGTMRSDPGDLFAAASGGNRRAEDDGGDLFGKPSTNSRQPAAGGASAADAAAAAAKLRGERNENSVLFSLGNLAQLASDKPASITAPPSQSGHATGAAGGEGSGLIDIRSMANAYLGGSGGGAAKPATSSAIGSIDDLPVFGGGGFSEPAVIVPTARPAQNNKMMFMLIGAVGLLAVAAVILVIVMLGKDDKKPDTVAGAGTTGEDKDKDKTEDKDKTPDKPADETKPAGGTDPAGTTAKTPETPTDPKPADSGAKPAGGSTKPTTTGSRPTTTASRPTDTKPRDPKPAGGTTAPDPKPADTGGGGCDEVSCVLNNYEGACCQKFRKGGSRPSGGGTAAKSGDLPDGLDRAMISEGVGKVKARVMSCGEKSSAKGQVKVSVKVSGDGNVTSVNVTATPDPALGSCVASAMQRATFRKTASGGSFGYPFVF
jgi:predicted Zn finger-like uncharacterized protein